MKYSVSSIHSFVTPLYIFEKEFDLDKIFKNIDEVDKDRIVEASGKIFKSAIFSVRPLKEDEWWKFYKIIGLENL